MNKVCTTAGLSDIGSMDPHKAIPPLASVIIVNYNGRSHLPACLNSLLNDDGVEMEIIVVDNASSDGSADLVAAAYPQARLIHSRENLGFGGANNLAAAHAQGEYLAFLNQDTVVTTGWLEALIHALEQTPQAGLSTPQILLLDQPDQVNAAGNEMHLTGLTLCRGLYDPAEQWQQPDRVTAVSGAAFVMRRSLFIALGGFDADFFMYFEDTDLSLRARLLGYDCRYVPQAVVYHDYALRFGPRKTYYEERNRYATLLKTLRWPTLILLLPLWLLGELVTWGFVLTRDRANWRNKPRAYTHILRQWPVLSAHRRRWQAQRQVSDRTLLRPMAYRLAFEQADAGLVARLAHLFFTPLFYLARLFVLAFVWW